jgi:hypothetical protein
MSRGRGIAGAKESHPSSSFEGSRECNEATAARNGRNRARIGLMKGDINDDGVQNGVQSEGK